MRRKCGARFVCSALMVNASSLSRRLKASILMLAVLAVLAAALAPLCNSLCCPLASPETSIHALMACCAGESNMTRTDPLREQRSASTAARTTTPQPPPVLALVAVLTAPDAPVVHHESPRIAARHDPSPPLFLLNAQFLI